MGTFGNEIFGGAFLALYLLAVVFFGLMIAIFSTAYWLNATEKLGYTLMGIGRDSIVLGVGAALLAFAAFEFTMQYRLDFEHARIGPWGGELGHGRDHVGLADGLLIPDGQGRVLIGGVARRIGHELVARNPAHGRQDTGVAHAANLDLVGDHAFPSQDEVVGGGLRVARLRRGSKRVAAET